MKILAEMRSRADIRGRGVGLRVGILCTGMIEARSIRKLRAKGIAVAGGNSYA